ncbi:MAG: YigZ family protein [Thermosediminibacteraceae bacterium]|nr:YigZ family protein [Thermosediminibacteraceae bacterium]
MIIQMYVEYQNIKLGCPNLASINEFLTVERPSESVLTIKKSKFICNVKPVSSLEEVEEFIGAVRKKYWDATHNVYAYCVGIGNEEIQKSSDDGEPSGTAGRPALEVIRSKQLKNVAVVISRYFGGILLGASGLIRAYSQSAKFGLENSGVIKMMRANEYSITVDYSTINRLESTLRNNKFLIGDINYGEMAEMHVYVPVNEVGRFEKCISELGIKLGGINFLKTCFVKTKP